jgi:hypothetical protein
MTRWASETLGRAKAVATFWRNPVVVRDLRVRMRGARSYWHLAIYLGLLSLLAMAGYATATQFASNPGGMNPVEMQQRLQIFYYFIFFTLAGLVCLIAPALTATSITTEKREAYVQSLSRGMQQRLCLAKCLVHDPKVLLLDEPASGLDPRARIEIKALIAELGKMGKTIIVSSHILSELADFCNKIGIIERGNMLVSGDVQTIVRQLQPARRLTIRTLGPLNGLRDALEAWPKVESVTTEEETAHVDFHGDLEDQVSMLRALMDGGHKICSFTETAINLEDVFMRVTTGKVQ